MLISENVPIKNLVTMRIGGPAKYVIEIKSKDEIPEACWSQRYTYSWIY